MSEVISEKNAIIRAVTAKLVELGSSVAQRMLEGKQAGDAYTEGVKILNLLRAYVKADELETSEVEALLYCMRKLSGAYDFPTVEPLVGKGITYVVDQAGIAEGGGIELIPGPDTVIYSENDEWVVITVDQLAQKLAPHILKY